MGPSHQPAGRAELGAPAMLATRRCYASMEQYQGLAQVTASTPLRWKSLGLVPIAHAVVGAATQEHRHGGILSNEVPCQRETDISPFREHKWRARHRESGAAAPESLQTWLQGRSAAMPSENKIPGECTQTDFNEEACFIPINMQTPRGVRDVLCMPSNADCKGSKSDTQPQESPSTIHAILGVRVAPTHSTSRHCQGWTHNIPVCSLAGGYVCAEG
jgi:hypothetical protein